MRIPLLDLVRQYRQLQGEIDPAMKAVLEKGAYILGENVETEEQQEAAGDAAATPAG